jgi:arginine repressor
MAKRKINKSEAIREFVRANGHVPTKEVVRALKAKGISVNAAMVSNVKSKAGLTRGGRGRPKKTAVRNVLSKRDGQNNA